VPQDVAERHYERWVMRAAELVHGDYPEDRWEAARLLLARMRDRFVDNVSPNAFWREGESTLEELGAYFSKHSEGYLEAARSLVFALYSAAGGQEWCLVVETEWDRATPSVSVRRMPALTAWDIPKSSALTISRRASGGYPSRSLAR